MIVYIISYFISSRKVNKLYMQKNEKANIELLHIMRPIIIDKSRFNIAIYNSIISSLSSRHKIHSIDMFSFSILGNEIIRDIMQTPFLQSETKDEYCKNILNAIENSNENNIEERTSKKTSSSSSYLSSYSRLLSLSLAITSLMFSLFAAFLYSNLNKKINIIDMINKSDLKILLIIMSLLVMVIIVPVTAMMLSRLLLKVGIQKKITKKDDENIEGDDQNKYND